MHGFDTVTSCLVCQPAGGCSSSSWSRPVSSQTSSASPQPNTEERSSGFGIDLFLCEGDRDWSLLSSSHSALYRETSFFIAGARRFRASAVCAWALWSRDQGLLSFVWYQIYRIPNLPRVALKYARSNRSDSNRHSRIRVRI